jgi:hypothetical protein
MPPRTRQESAADLEREGTRASTPPSQGHSSSGIEAQLATAIALEAELKQELELRETGEQIRQLQRRIERVGEAEALP